MIAPSRARVELQRQSGHDLLEFLDHRVLETQLFQSNSASLLTIIALGRQAHEGLTTVGEVPQKIRQRLCELTRIPPDQHDSIIDLLPTVAKEGDIQVVCLKPIFNGKLPGDAEAPFVSWGQLMSGFFSTMLARPSLSRPGEYVFTYTRQENFTYESLFASHISGLLWADEQNLPEGTFITPSIFTAKGESQIATRSIFPF